MLAFPRLTMHVSLFFDAGETYPPLKDACNTRVTEDDETGKSRLRGYVHCFKPGVQRVRAPSDWGYGGCAPKLYKHLWAGGWERTAFLWQRPAGGLPRTVQPLDPYP
jgi:hypothetical protein